MKSFLLMAAFVLVLTACGGESYHQTYPESVSVLGTGLIQAEPDKATLIIGSSAKEPTAIKAKEKADAAYRKILTVLKKANIPKKHIKVTNLSIRPEYQWQGDQQIYKGERVSRTLQIEVHDLEKVSSLVQDLVGSGVTTINRIQTGFIDQKALQRQAMALATKDAKQKADFLAQQLDRDLGVAFDIIEDNNGAPWQRPAQLEGFSTRAQSIASDVPPDMFGTQDVRAMVKVRFKLQ